MNNELTMEELIESNERLRNINKKLIELLNTLTDGQFDKISEEVLDEVITRHLDRGIDYPKWMSDSLKRIEAKEKLKANKK